MAIDFMLTPVLEELCKRVRTYIDEIGKPIEAEMDEITRQGSLEDEYLKYVSGEAHPVTPIEPSDA